MKSYLKFGGLALSSALTMSLFVRLFGMGAYGLLMALAALALFEGGAIAWSHILTQAKHGQRAIAKLGLWFCILASVVSSGAEIILATNLWTAPFDVSFLTLLVIVGALAVNVCGIVAYEQLDPASAARNRELDRQARARNEAARLEESIIDQSLIKAEGEVAKIAGSVSDLLARELTDDVSAYLLASTRGGDSGKRLPVMARAEAMPEDDDRYFDAPTVKVASNNGNHSRPKA